MSVPSACTQHPLEAAFAPVTMDQTTDHPPTIEMDETSSLTPQYDLNSSALQERLLKLEAELAREKMRGHSAVQEARAVHSSAWRLSTHNSSKHRGKSMSRLCNI